MYPGVGGKRRKEEGEGKENNPPGGIDQEWINRKKGKDKNRRILWHERQPAPTRSIHVAPTHIITPLLCHSRRGARDRMRSWLILERGDFGLFDL